MFFFSYDFRPYIAIIGDIFNSKQINDRYGVQEKLMMVLDDINKVYYEDIASRFMITLGDEFQGLMLVGTNIMEIIEKIEQEMYPIRIRFGIGIGKITTKINPDLPLGADGPAYYNARNMINELKNDEKKKMKTKLNMKIKIEHYDDIAELINTIFSLNTVLKEKWTKRQREIIKAYLNNDGTQAEIAYKLGIHQSNVQKALSYSGFYTYQKALNNITKILSGIKEMNNV